MPNKRYRNKRGGAHTGATDRSKSIARTDSVKDLLGRLTPRLTAVSDPLRTQKLWRNWLAERLPAELCQRISGIVEHNGTLLVFAESAGWAARLRYALQELHGPLRASHPTIQHVSVRVLPKA